MTWHKIKWERGFCLLSCFLWRGRVGNAFPFCWWLCPQSLHFLQNWKNEPFRGPLTFHRNYIPCKANAVCFHAESTLTSLCARNPKNIYHRSEFCWITVICWEFLCGHPLHRACHHWETFQELKLTKQWNCPMVSARGKGKKPCPGLTAATLVQFTARNASLPGTLLSSLCLALFHPKRTNWYLKTLREAELKLKTWNNGVSCNYFHTNGFVACLLKESCWFHLTESTQDGWDHHGKLYNCKSTVLGKCVVCLCIHV